jgi:ABC-2 type transport system ATP-binding protein
MTNREIVVQHLVKRYGKDFKAVNDVSLKVSSGEIYGFLGPNGAGKSTTVKILTTLALPTSGHASVGGYDVRDEANHVRAIAGVALQEISLDPLMKSMELLTIQGELFGQPRREAKRRAMELLELVRLTDALEKRVGQYSGGMRRRLDLALALVHKPDILFLDEPTTGLDPASRRDVWNEVRRLNRELGMTIFLTTQYLEEADELAERIAIIDRGQIAVEGAPAALKASMGREAINISFDEAEKTRRAQGILQALASQTQLDGKVLRLYLPQAAQAVPQVVTTLEEADLRPVSLTLSQPTLDDVFLQVTGQRYVEEGQRMSGQIAAVKGQQLSAVSGQ